jgi:hypothetical protein
MESRESAANWAGATVSVATSLEYGTKLVGPIEARWSFALYPEAAEGGGSFRSSAREMSGGDAPAPDPDRNAADAGRRARSKVRRYCAANRLNRLGTLTYAGSGNHDPAALRVDLADFFRRLRGSVGEAYPYLWVPEWHPGGHGLHVHFAVGRWIAYGAIKRAWGRGIVNIKLLGDLPVGSGTLGEARLAARYLAKYVGKDLDGAGQPSGLHRYEVAQGFQARQVDISGTSADEVIGWAETYMGASAERVWRSRDEEAWDGPPSVWAQWR